ncbi:hypothetical protein TNCV_4523411 [Trichonephila clavipes]|nr:hypothetical protein TNCV_4523411 [Trichonephila clavipes]
MEALPTEALYYRQRELGFERVNFTRLAVQSWTILKVTKNGFFGKVQKRGFTNVSNRIGSGSVEQSQIIELKDLITNSDRYDEEFVKDVLSVIVEERTATEKQKAAELEEKQKAVVVAQQREREFELKK